MFHLNTRIHFDKEKLPILIEKLERACTGIAHVNTSLYARVTHFLSQCFGNARRWRLFDNFLVTPLQRAISITQMHRVALSIRENLYLDVPRPLQKLFHVDNGRAKCGGCLRLRNLNR